MATGSAGNRGCGTCSVSAASNVAAGSLLWRGSSRAMRRPLASHKAGSGMNATCGWMDEWMDEWMDATCVWRRKHVADCVLLQGTWGVLKQENRGPSLITK